MRPSYRVRRPWLVGGIFVVLLVALALVAGVAREGQTFTGVITDTECGPDHAPMLAKGDMGKDDHECTLACVRKGATFGFVDESNGRFYQLDDQETPAPLAGHKVRVEGRVEGDTIRVKSLAAAD